MLKTFQDYGIQLKPGASGEVKTTCPQCSHTRKKKNYPCLNVNIDKGVWNCWHCSWSGTLKHGEQQRPEVRKTYIKPEYAAPKVTNTLEDWFSKRGITKLVIDRNLIGVGDVWFPQVEEERNCITFPYLRGDEVINIKYRTRDKLFRMASGAERVLYGLNDIAETLYWVEGEIDKLSVEVAGFKNCVSVPDGAPAPESKSYGSKFDFLGETTLETVKKHIIAVDSDAPGRRLEEELIRRLGEEKCYVVRWPDGCKDANDVLVKLGKDELAEILSNPEPLPIVGAHTLSDFHEAFVDLYERGDPPGFSTGWKEVDACYTVRPGDLTVVTGIPNSGKSEFIDAMMVNMAANLGWSFGVFSAENWPITEHAKKLAEKYIGKPFGIGRTERMTHTERDVSETWISKHFHFVQPESPSIEAILRVMRQLVLRHGIRGMVIDPWNEIEHSRPESMSETEYIGSVLSEIRRFARSHLLHAWLVAHPTKLRKEPDGSYPVPTPYDISGSANWRNKADCCLSIWRDLSPMSSNSVQVHIQKIRHKSVGQLGMAEVFYDRVTGIYQGAQRIKPPYLRCKDNAMETF